ncbi:MAG: hypothetical protein ACJAR4_002563 [Psychroserpens sp.]
MLPVLVYLNFVSTGVPLTMVPKSCSASAKEITGKSPAVASLSAAAATLDELILLVASSLQDVKATKHNALNAKIAFFIAIIFKYFLV